MPSLGSGSGHVVRHIPLWTEALNTAVKRKKKIIVVIIHVEKGLRDEAECIPGLFLSTGLPAGADLNRAEPDQSHRYGGGELTLTRQCATALADRLPGQCVALV